MSEPRQRRETPSAAPARSAGAEIAAEAAAPPDPAPSAARSAGEEAELELRRHFHGRRAGQRISAALAVELVCLARNVAARTVNLSRSGVILEVLDGNGQGMAELFSYCQEIERLFAAGGTLDFECGVSRTVHVVRITAGGLGGRMVPLVACRFTEPLEADDFRAMGIVPPPSTEDVDDPEGDAAARPQVLQPGGDAVRRKSPAIHELVRWAVELDATDIHVKAGSLPRLRVNAELSPVGAEPLSEEAVRAMIRNFLTAEQWEQFDREGDLDAAYALEGIGRFRINVLRSRGRCGMVIRRIPDKVPDAASLGLAQTCLTLAGKRRGLVLVTGGSGSGKSTTLAAMLRHVNETRRCHIVTLEDPIEYVHEEILAEVTQREIGHDTRGFAEALHKVVRQDPDVIMVGEMRDLDTIKLAVTAAETGHLVFATLHTTSAAQTVDRIVDVFPSEQQRQVRIQLAGTLQGIVSQVLLPRLGGGRAVAQEILVATDAVRALIREGKTPQIQNALQTGLQEGMQMLDDSLNALVRDGVISHEVAVHHATVPQRIRPAPGSAAPPPAESPPPAPPAPPASPTPAAPAAPAVDPRMAAQRRRWNS
jgi:twitching motility protein PilT